MSKQNHEIPRIICLFDFPFTNKPSLPVICIQCKQSKWESFNSIQFKGARVCRYCIDTFLNPTNHI